MTVSLSPIGGVASQFFNSGGVPLYGGKIYTYEAGTTTPKATYTEVDGLAAHSNPIILDSAGRVPGGEIWLTSAQAYLFVLKTSRDETIGTYDNIYGINAGSANAVTETQVATAGQTDFVLTSMIYTPGVFTLGVYIDGVNQVVNNSYVETSANTVTFVSGLHAGALVKFININSAATDSNVVSYLPAGAGAVATTVQAKLRESVSVKDFGAVGDGVADDGAKINAALASGVALDLNGTTLRSNVNIVLPNNASIANGKIILGGSAQIQSSGSATDYASSGNYPVGTSQIVLTSAVGLAVGDSLLLTTKQGYSNYAGYIAKAQTEDDLDYQGQYVTVNSIVGNTVDFFPIAAFAYDFTLAGNDKASVRKVVSTKINLFDVDISSVSPSGLTGESSLIYLVYSRDSTVINCTLDGAKVRGGIYSTLGWNNKFAFNTIRNTDYLGIYLREVGIGNSVANNTVESSYAQDSGIFLTAGCWGNTVTTNTISGYSHSGAVEMNGISLHAKCHSNTVTGNAITGVNFGIRLALGALGNTITGNTITDCAYLGILCEESHRNIITDNALRTVNCVAYTEQAAITIIGGKENDVARNTIDQVIVGVRVDGDGNTVDENRISNVAYGVYLFSANKGSVSKNKIKNFTSQAILTGSVVGSRYNEIRGNRLSIGTSVSFDFGIYIPNPASGNSWFNVIEDNQSDGVDYLVSLGTNQLMQQVHNNISDVTVINANISGLAASAHVGAPMGFRLYQIYAQPWVTARTIDYWEFCTANVWNSVVVGAVTNVTT